MTRNNNQINNVFQPFKRLMCAFVKSVLLVSFSASVLASQSSNNLLPAPAPASSKSFESSQRLTPISVQTNWNHQFQFAGFYAAKKQGYYKKAGLDVTIKDWKSGTNVVKEVIEGRADFGTSKGDVLANYAKGAPVSLVMASFQFSPLVLLSHEPIDDLSQLSGKTVMYHNGLQISGLLNKADYIVKSPIKRLATSGDINDFVNNKVDFYAAYTTNEPYRLKKRNIPFYLVDPKGYGVQNYGDLVITTQQNANFNPSMVEAFKKATIKGWQYAIAHQDEIVDYIIKNYSVVKDRESLIAEARATTQYVKTGDTPIGSVDPIKLMSMAATVKEIGLITDQEFSAINMQNFIFDASRTTYSKEELDYLHQHPVITIGTDRDWGPFEFFDSVNGYSGMSADYFKLFEKKLGVKFKPEFSDSWASVTRLAEQGKIDLYTCAVATPEREQYMRFTKPYLSFPMALAATEKSAYVGDYSQLEGYTVAVVKDYWSHEFLKTHYPKVKLMVVPNVVDGLSAVIDGRADGYLGNLAVINFNVRKFGMEGIRIVGQFPHHFELAMGVQKSEPILFSIMQKALASVTKAEREEIFSRWVKLKVVNNLDTKQLLQILIPTLLIIFVLLVLLMVYAYQKRKQKEYIREIYELSLATEIDLNSRTIIWASKSFMKLTGYSHQELKGMSYLQLAREDIPTEFVEHIHALLMSGSTWVGDVEARKKTGESYWIELTLTPNKNLWGNVNRVLATRVDITDKKRIEKLSVSDVLTGLFNRRHYNEIIELEIRRSQREHLALGLVMLDIDFFKAVNDNYGHQQGDLVLKQISNVLKDAFNRANDHVFRVGGEEFMVICRFKTQQDFETYLKKVCLQVEALAIKNEGAINDVVTISVGGVYSEPSRELNAEDLFKTVDLMLYEAKQNGRNQVVVYTPDKEA